MNDGTYITWKKWNAKEFASLGPGERFYYRQVLRCKSKKKHKVLEIGFGNGTLLRYFKNIDYEVIGVEINKALVEKALSTGFRAYNGFVWDISELKCEKFDLIVGLDVAEHMSQDELNKLFVWAKNHMNKEARLCLRFPEGGSPLGLVNQNGDFTHVSSLTVQKINWLCSNNNMVLYSYSDDLLSSNKLCSFGITGTSILIILQMHSKILRILMKFILYPLCPALRLSLNSIAVITKNEE